MIPCGCTGKLRNARVSNVHPRGLRLVNHSAARCPRSRLAGVSRRSRSMHWPTCSYECRYRARPAVLHNRGNGCASAILLRLAAARGVEPQLLPRAALCLACRLVSAQRAAAARRPCKTHADPRQDRRRFTQRFGYTRKSRKCVCGPSTFSLCPTIRCWPMQGACVAK